MSTQLARDVMTPNVRSVNEDWSLEELARFFIDNSISGAPVVNRAGKLVGVVSLTDLARVQAERDSPAPEAHDFFARSFEAGISPDEVDVHFVRESAYRVGDVMTKAVFSVNEDAPVTEIADMMVRGRIHRVFVMRKHEIVGVVAALDLLKLLCEP